jgi:hypothetical protein
MAIIEIEIDTFVFRRMIDLVLTAAPTPVPTLNVLGSDRLIDSMAWEPIELGDAFAPPNYTRPNGILTARARVKVKHVSIAELDANPKATHSETTLIASLIVTASPDELAVSVLQFDVGVVTPYVFGLPLRIGSLLLPLAWLGVWAAAGLVDTSLS